MPVSRGPHNLPHFVSWSCQDARDASASGLVNAQQQARSAIGAVSCLLSPGRPLLARRHPHLGRNETSSSHKQ